MGDSVARSLEKAKGYRKTAREIAKANPGGASKLRDKATTAENKAINRIGKRPRKSKATKATGISLG